MASRFAVNSAHAEHLIVGGGLAGGLVALALARSGRGAGVVLVEQGEALGGNHTWSFHDTDLDGAGQGLVADLVARRWPRQEVRFPAFTRILSTGYASITSAHFARTLTPRLLSAGVRIYLGQAVREVRSESILLENGTRLTGGLVMDARGPEPRESGPARGGFQKFVGLEVELGADGPWSVPLLMDATVSQHDGYRFMYVLPFSPRRVLLEDTVYSSNPTLDLADYEQRVHDFATQAGATISRVLRREAGVLPLPTHDCFAAVPHPADEACALAVGYRGGFFHCVTGYSLSLAVRVALAIAAADSPREARTGVAAIRHQMEAQGRFGYLLNRLMFHAMPATSRWTAFERFYRLPEATIARFYGSQSTWADRARVLVGRPPPGISWRHLAVNPFGRKPLTAKASFRRLPERTPGKEAHQQ